MSGPVLYAIVCGSPAARNVGNLVALAQARGWEVCVVATPDALKFIDVPEKASDALRRRVFQALRDERAAASG